jgi:hypothetical protein
MQKRKWDAKTKAMIVIEGLKGKPVAAIAPSVRSANPNITNGVTSF